MSSETWTSTTVVYDVDSARGLFLPIVARNSTVPTRKVVALQWDDATSSFLPAGARASGGRDRGARAPAWAPPPPGDRRGPHGAYWRPAAAAPGELVGLGAGAAQPLGLSAYCG